MSMDPLLAKLARIQAGDLSADENLSAQTSKKEEAASRYITFMLGSSWFALPMDVIKEVSPISPTAKIPHADPWMDSILSFRGQMITAINLAAYFELRTDDHPIQDQAVVDVGGFTFAVLVSKIGEVLMEQDMKNGEGLPRVHEKEKRMTKYVNSVFKIGERIVSVFDPTALHNVCMQKSDTIDKDLREVA